jgi:lipopolysaccharide/colanic/teichoic acid biosynthesis glycosyltransferase
MYKKYYKRVIDFIISLILIILLSPLLILAIIVLSISNQGKPFFFQQRPGKNCKIFTIIKLKTMNEKKDDKGNLLTDERRLTKVGVFIRKTSLDEIPQLINVLKGDMSLIGPRPLLVSYLPFYKEEERLRHSVRPGITGLAQVNGRNTVSWDKRLALDVDYVENLSFKQDVKILCSTVLKVIVSENIITNPKSLMKDLDEERKNRNTKIQQGK